MSVGSSVCHCFRAPRAQPAVTLAFCCRLAPFGSNQPGRTATNKSEDRCTSVPVALIHPQVIDPPYTHTPTFSPLYPMSDYNDEPLVSSHRAVISPLPDYLSDLYFMDY
ncbi:hypothetical protein Bbelb_441780 [Branchiostoma belcheri]|nr:hypothetical protein Bbelb_441780 [Branchiostoma belcheri]